MLPFVICLVVTEREGTGGEHFINSETKGALGALTPDCGPGCWAGGHWDENQACCTVGGRGGGSLTQPPACKWTGNANTATVGERTGSGVQATGSAGGRLMVGGVLGEVGGQGFWGKKDCTNILSHYPDSFITSIMNGRAREVGGFLDSFTPA